MTNRGIIWTGAAALSILVHGGALVALTLATKPDPIADQPTPTSRLNIESQKVERATASESDAPAEKAPEGTANTAQIAQGAIQQTNAVAATLTPVTATASDPKPQTQSALTAVAEIKQAAAPQSTTLNAATVPTQPLKPATASAIKTAALSNPSAKASRVESPTALAPSTPTDSVAADTQTLTLPAEKGTASLAWSGDGTMDPVSLAAIQAFMQPGDATQNTTTVRDGISAVLAAVPCARLQTVFVPETGELLLRGHIPEPEMRGPILAALTAQVGSAIPVSDDLLILPRPQCGALSGIADVGLPQSTDQITNPRVVGPSGFARNYTYTNGQRLTLDLTAPDYDGYIYVDYFTADGNVLHLQPNTTVPLEFAAAKSAQSVGKPRDDGQFLELTVSPPYGQEIAAAFAASTPLYDDLRPIQEPAAPYLAFLKSRVAAARAKDPNFKGEWVYFFISTKAE